MPSRLQIECRMCGIAIREDASFVAAGDDPPVHTGCAEAAFSQETKSSLPGWAEWFRWSAWAGSAV